MSSPNLSKIARKANLSSLRFVRCLCRLMNAGVQLENWGCNNANQYFLCVCLTEKDLPEWKHLQQSQVPRKKRVFTSWNMLLCWISRLHVIHNLSNHQK